MKKKITAFIISLFLFSLSVPQACFAELGFYFKKGKSVEISSKTAQVINLLDISDKIVRKYYGGTKYFFLKMYVKSFENNGLPAYIQKSVVLFLHSAAAMIINAKKNVYCGKEYLIFEEFPNYLMRVGPFFGAGREIIKQYLLSIEALQKGSVPAFAFTINNMLF
ncbi:MAG: hypothetical protein LBD46_08430 [Endomicrobium sp.]|jgi:hypothetical protein|nr:hypothetical protein [Endomicrobium sp.]